MLNKFLSVSSDDKTAGLNNAELQAAIDKSLELLRLTTPLERQYHYLERHLFDLIWAQRSRASDLSDMTAAELQATIERTMLLLSASKPVEKVYHYLRTYLFDLLHIQRELAQKAA
jgi:hypothetical protein